MQGCPPFCSTAETTTNATSFNHVDCYSHSSWRMHSTTLYGGTCLRLLAMFARGFARLLFTPQDYTNWSLAPDIVIANAQRDRHGFLQTIAAVSHIFAAVDHSQ